MTPEQDAQVINKLQKRFPDIDRSFSEISSLMNQNRRAPPEGRNVSVLGIAKSYAWKSKIITSYSNLGLDTPSLDVKQDIRVLRIGDDQYLFSFLEFIV